MNTVLVANRGEIALRIMRTCKKMGLRTVAVFSDADARAPHVAFADRAVRLGPAPAKDSYLNRDALLRAAVLSEADAVHPGYGFLSENADFAAACEHQGLTFVGPRSQAIRAMGLKREAKALVAQHGVPLVPGYDGADQSPAVLKARALELGLPVIFKPSAGGGGKGMKIVRTPDALDDAIESGRREAMNAFGDSTLIIEKYLERARHVEVQLLGDTHGNLVHLFERECSIQRRHQKVIEETPCVALRPEQRDALCRAALAVGRAVSYTSAGTVEFIVDAATGQFSFSEMNTRLQVEHRVTELVTGLDLVEEQLRIARGEKLRFAQADVRSTGHAIEARLCAEDPANSFLPSAGTLVDWHTGDVDDRLIIDAGIETGTEVSPHYDSMLAKVVAWGTDRAAATGRLTSALESLSVQGVTTNRDFLAQLLKHPDFVGGELHTAFIAEHARLTEARPDAARDEWARVAATLFTFERRREATSHLPGVPSGYRNNRFSDQVSEFDVTYRALGRGAFLVNGKPWAVIQADLTAGLITLQSPEGLRVHARVHVGTRAQGHEGRVFVHTSRGDVVLTAQSRFPEPGDAAVDGGLIAPMPGKVIRVLVGDGEAVRRGQPLLVLEAMKMEQTTVSPKEGIVGRVLVRAGDQVTAGQVLAVMQ